LPISDSERGTTRSIELRSLSTAKAELEEPELAEEVEEPAPERAAELDPAPAVEPPPAVELEEEPAAARVVPVADTSSPT
jgi:hypothetical protein